MYDRMAGVAKKLDKEVMLDIYGKITLDSDKMVGRKTKYILTLPEQVLFVDETGCNTNQTEDHLVGGRLYVLPRHENDGGKIGSTTDIHFTLLCFSAATGDPLMCAIILKSEQDIKDIPIHWKFGIDIRKNVVTGKNEVEILDDVEFLELNSGENKAVQGGSINDAFKMLLNKSKIEYIEHRQGDMRFLMSDIIPLANMCWSESFGRSDRARRAIASRGWGPMANELHPLGSSKKQKNRNCE